MRPIISAALAAATITLAACGGSGRDTAKPLTRAELIAKADTLCKASNARTRELNDAVKRASAGARGDKDLLRRIAPILQNAYASVRDNAAAFQVADPPPADAAAIARIRKTYDQQADLARKLGSAAKAGDVQTFNLLSTQQQDVVARARKLTRAYGFKVCGSSRSDSA